VPAVSAADLILPAPAEGSADVAARVAAARELQRARDSALGLPGLTTNAAAPAALIEDIARPRYRRKQSRARCGRTHAALGARFPSRLETRAHDRRSRGSPLVRREHLAEALSYRSRGTTTSMAA